MKISVQLLLCCILFPLLSFSQKENNHWIFANYCGIDFNKSNLDSTYTVMTSSHSIANLSDSNGRLLIYGNGKNFYGKNHYPILNSKEIIAKPDNYFSRNTVAMKKPYSDSEVYIFTVNSKVGVYNPTAIQLSEFNLYRHTVRLNNKDRIPEISKLNEKVKYNTEDVITFTQHQDKKRFWLISAQSDTNCLVVFLIDSGSIDTNGIKFYYKYKHNPCLAKNYPNRFKINYWSKNITDIRISPNSKRISFINSYDGTFELFDFDNTNGKISNQKTYKINFQLQKGYLGFASNLSFSPDNSKIYLTNYHNGGYFYDKNCNPYSYKIDSLLIRKFNNNSYGYNAVLQYDLSLPNDSIISKNVNVFSNQYVFDWRNSSQNGYTDIQVAPDGKIYSGLYFPYYCFGNGYGYGYNCYPNFWKPNLIRMSRIEFPNVKAPYCNYKDSLKIYGYNSLVYQSYYPEGLPNIGTYHHNNPINFKGTCIGDSTTINVDVTNFDSINVFIQDGTKIKTSKNTIKYKFNKFGLIDVYVDVYFKNKSVRKFSNKVLIENAPFKFFPKDTLVCEKAFLFLENKDTFSNIVWNDTIRHGEMVFRKTGMYKYEQFNQCGSIKDSIFVKFSKFQKLKIRDSLICDSPFVLINTKLSDSKITWFDNDTFPIKKLDSSGTFTYSSLQLCGSFKDTFNLQFLRRKDFVLPKDFYLCKDSVIELGFKYKFPNTIWNYIYFQDSFKTDTIGTVVVFSRNDCGVYTDEIRILPFVTRSQNIKDSTFCVGKSYFASFFASDGKYKWNNSSLDTSIKIENEGVYSIKINSPCLVKEEIFKIKHFPKPKIDIELPSKFCIEQIPVNLPYSGIYDSLQIFKNNELYPKKLLELDENTSLMFVAKNRCNQEVTKNLDIKFDTCKLSIFVPNSFSPDFSGLNDVFKPTIIGGFNNFQMVIYNRWGERLFKSSNYQDGWNGFYKNEIVPSGVYLFYIQIEDGNGNFITKSGTVTLLR